MPPCLSLLRRFQGSNSGPHAGVAHTILCHYHSSGASCLSVAGHYFIWCTCHLLFVRSSADWHFGCFYFGAIISHAALNIHVQTLCEYTFGVFSDTSLRVELLHHMEMPDFFEALASFSILACQCSTNYFHHYINSAIIYLTQGSSPCTIPFLLLFLFPFIVKLLDINAPLTCF